MIWTIICAVLIIEGAVVWASWYQKTYFKWITCPHCGSMMEVHREDKRFDGKYSWQGKCDQCYNYFDRYTD